MPKEDWQNSAVHKILQKNGLWNFKTGEIQTVLDVACGLSLKSKFLEQIYKLSKNTLSTILNLI